MRTFPTPNSIAALAAGLLLGATSLRAADIPPQVLAPQAREASAAAGRRPPIVIVPGAPGTELLDRATGERVWPSARLMAKRDGNELLALPLGDSEGSSIVAGGLLRAVHVGGLKFRIHAYDGLEKKLRKLGYRPGDWTAPTGEGEYFYFPYDWRQSVEVSGRRFSRELEAFYRRSPPGTPPAIVLGHSLGGLLARYALMYGDAPLGEDGPLPPVTWAGSAHIGTIFLVATPNDGTFIALKRLEKGIFYRWHRGGFSPETLFTFPAVFDMIPGRIAPLVDGHGNPLLFDLDNPNDWERLGWSVVDPLWDSATPYVVRRDHLERELARSNRMRTAMNQLATTPNPVTLYVVASLSWTVQRTALVTERHRGGIKVRFDTAGRARLKPLLREPGDSMVPIRSLVAEDSSHDPASSLCFARVVRSKKSHQALISSPEMLEALGEVLK
jgi:pimeloyl-ACP methyl ester carboxylesterase